MSSPPSYSESSKHRTGGTMVNMPENGQYNPDGMTRVEVHIHGPGVDPEQRALAQLNSGGQCFLILGIFLVVISSIQMTIDIVSTGSVLITNPISFVQGVAILICGNIIRKNTSDMESLQPLTKVPKILTFIIVTEVLLLIIAIILSFIEPFYLLTAFLSAIVTYYLIQFRKGLIMFLVTSGYEV